MNKIMPSNFPKNLITQAQAVFGGWDQLSPVPTLGPLTITGFSADIKALSDLDVQILGLEALLADKRNQRRNAAVSLWDKVKRVRNAIKGIFGDDSSQYEMVGGVRLSERKPRTRKRGGTE
jgi:hypothetical protein